MMTVATALDASAHTNANAPVEIPVDATPTVVTNGISSPPTIVPPVTPGSQTATNRSARVANDHTRWQQSDAVQMLLSSHTAMPDAMSSSDGAAMAPSPAGSTIDLTPAASTAGSVADQVGRVVIHIAAGDGSRKISLQLAPEALGHLDIQIDQPKDGPTMVKMTTDNPQTLALLQNDHRQLSDVLDRAGIASDHRVLSFHLAAQTTEAVVPAQPASGHSGAHTESPPDTSGQGNATNASLGQHTSGSGSGADDTRRNASTRQPYAGLSVDDDRPGLTVSLTVTTGLTTSAHYSGLNITA